MIWKSEGPARGGATSSRLNEGYFFFLPLTPFSHRSEVDGFCSEDGFKKNGYSNRI